MVRKICLDSDVLISLLAGEPKTKQKLEELEAEFCTTAINTFELWFGRKKGEAIFRLIKWLPILDFDEVVARLAADILRKLKKDGKLLELRDLFIAAICIKNDIELLSYDEHFKRLKRFGLNLA